MTIGEKDEWFANRWRILAGVLLVFTFTSFIIKLLPLPVKLVPLPDQLFLTFLALILMFQKRRVCRLFLIDWAPFILFLILYDMMLSFAPMLYGQAHIAEPVQWELNTFAWFTNGEIPAFTLQNWVGFWDQGVEGNWEWLQNGGSGCDRATNNLPKERPANLSSLYAHLLVGC